MHVSLCALTLRILEYPLILSGYSRVHPMYLPGVHAWLWPAWRPTSLHPLRILSFKEDYTVTKIMESTKMCGCWSCKCGLWSQAHAHKTYTCMHVVHSTDQRVFTILYSVVNGLDTSFQRCVHSTSYLYHWVSVCDGIVCTTSCSCMYSLGSLFSGPRGIHRSASIVQIQYTLDLHAWYNCFLYIYT